MSSTHARTVGEWLGNNVRLVLTTACVLTVVLTLPAALMRPDETASQHPTNRVTEAQDLIGEAFAPPAHTTWVVVEATDGNILSKQSLVALRDRSEALKADPATGPLLHPRYLPELGVESDGVYTIADAVDEMLRARGGPGLAGADQVTVSAAVADLIEPVGSWAWNLSTDARVGENGHWRALAAVLPVEADNEALGGGGVLVTLGTDDLRKEEYSREVLRVLRSDDGWLDSWLVAADVNLTSIEEGNRAGPFIALTVFIVLVVTHLVFGSYWLTAISGFGLGALMIWLQGITNLVGIERDQMIATIVPISMISFGIDSAFHVHGRYREAAASGATPRRAMGIGWITILGPIALALASDSAAFLANLISPIESVRQFGVASTIAAVAAFSLLGICTPLATSEIEERHGGRPLTRFGPRGDLAAAAVAATGATVAVLITVFVSPLLGAGLLTVYGVAAIAVPLSRMAGGADAGLPSPAGTERVAAMVEKVVVWSCGRPEMTLGLAAAATTVAGFFALQVGPSFDVTDFFDAEVDFVVGIDKVQEYSAGQAGELAAVVVTGDLSDPAALSATADLVDTLRATNTDLLARTDEGTLVRGGIVDAIRDAMDPSTLIPVTGFVAPTDRDGDGLPDTADDFTRLADAVETNGLVGADGGLIWAPGALAAVFAPVDGGYATNIEIELPDTSSQDPITEARSIVEPLVADLDAQLTQFDPTASATLTGSPVFRDVQLAAIIDSLVLSLPIAVVACFILAAAFTGSVRLGLISVVPLLLVVAWLYGYMEVAGHGVNVVTATIAAISIGVGIDFSTHMTLRLREELAQAHDSLEAVAAAARGTGTALTGSAATSMAGFGVLAFAPMPMFATYGVLTAMMILFALASCLLVLPSLLLVFGGEISPVIQLDSSRVGGAGSSGESAGADTGGLRVAVAPDLDPGLVDRVAAAAMAEGWEGSIVVMSEEAMMAEMTAGRLDLMVGSAPTGTGPMVGADTQVTELFRESIWVVSGSGRPPDADSLHLAPWVVGPVGSSWDLVTRGVMNVLNANPVRVWTVDSLTTAEALVRTSGAVAVLPEGVAVRLRGEGYPTGDLTHYMTTRSVVAVAGPRAGSPAANLVENLVATTPANPRPGGPPSARAEWGYGRWAPT